MDDHDALESSGESFVLFGDWRDEALLNAIGEALVLERQRERTEPEAPRSPSSGGCRAAGVRRVRCSPCCRAPRPK